MVEFKLVRRLTLETLNTQFSSKKFDYSGKELRSHFLLENFELKGSAMLAACGSCFVDTNSLVDQEDRLQNTHIKAKEMIHFLGEFFHLPIQQGVLLQRLFVGIVGESINHHLGVNRVHRFGDDLFVDRKKLSVSIVAPSAISQLLHLGINIDPAGAPVAAVGLKNLMNWKDSEFEHKTQELSLEIMREFRKEVESMHWACVKVRPVL